jgi:hypothetical protein
VNRINRFDVYALIMLLIFLPSCVVGVLVLNKYADGAGTPFIVIATFWFGSAFRSLKQRAWVEEIRQMGDRHQRQQQKDKT